MIHLSVLQSSLHLHIHILFIHKFITKKPNSRTTEVVDFRLLRWSDIAHHWASAACFSYSPNPSPRVRVFLSTKKREHSLLLSNNNQPTPSIPSLATGKTRTRKKSKPLFFIHFFVDSEEYLKKSSLTTNFSFIHSSFGW